MWGKMRSGGQDFSDISQKGTEREPEPAGFAKKDVPLIP
jgi:hypothetical protein